MKKDNNRPKRSRRSLRSDAKASRRVQKKGAQNTHMDERMEAAFLCVQVLNGDGSAFDQLYGQHSKAVHNHISAGLFPVQRNRHLEVLTQDAWVLIWQHLGQYDPSKASFRRFAKYWAHFALVRWLRRRRQKRNFIDALMEHQRRYPEMENDLMDQLENLVDVSTVEDGWDREALAAKADKAIGQLLRTKSDPLEILSVLLAMFHEWPPREIAAQLSGRTLWAITNLVAGLVRQQTDLPPKRVKAHFSRLRTQLRVKVEDVMKGRRHLRLLRRHRGARVGDLPLKVFFTGRVKGGRPAEIVKWRASAVTRLRQLACIRLAAKKNSRHP